VIVYAVVDDALSRLPARLFSKVFIRRENAERFIAEVRGDDPEVAKKLRIKDSSRDGSHVRSRH
jgi:hypothetical protein